MKKIFFTLTFMSAIVLSFAFKARPTNANGFYFVSATTCSTSAMPTNESGCTTGGLGAQCTVDVSGNPLAWNKNTCTIALKLP